MTHSRSHRYSRSARPWITPPGLLVMDEPFEGFLVLDEVRSELGGLLWQSLRDVDLWTATPLEARAELFTPHALPQRLARIAVDVEPESPLRPVLDGIAGVLDPQAPPTREQISEWCDTASRWASDQGYPRTALAYAQRSAVAAPTQAGPAYLVGLVARRMADYRRAETWFRRALSLGRQNSDWQYFGLAQLGLANMHMQRGDAPSARRRLLKALRAARRYGLWPVRPMVLHDLFCIAATGGETEQAYTYARAAFRAYGRRHPRLPVLAHDIACFWMLRGENRLALPIFRAVVPHMVRTPERMLSLSNVARSAGGAGDPAAFEQAWREVWHIVDERADTERVPEALINLAHGAAALGEAVRMEMASSQALTLAIRRRESAQRIAAEELLAQSRQVARRRRMRRPPPPPPVLPLPALELGEPTTAEQLAEDLVEALLEAPREV